MASARLLAWIHSYFTDRLQEVKFGGQHFDKISLAHQGSVSVPILLNLYTADIVYIARAHSASVLCCADDMLLNFHCRPGDPARAAIRLL